MATYRVGFLSPELGSLAAGELYVEVTPAGGDLPRLWVGTPQHVGVSGNVALMVPAAVTDLSVITVDPVDNPSSAHTVHITGTVVPGCEIELAALQGQDLVQVTSWSPWDAGSGAFDVLWYLPPGDDYRVRARMRAAPESYTDSNLFLVQ